MLVVEEERPEHRRRRIRLRLSEECEPHSREEHLQLDWEMKFDPEPGWIDSYKSARR